jgi:adenylate cyclase
VPTDQIERKLAAIFAADVEGYSRLMGLDEVGTLRTLTAYREIIDALIAQDRGRIFNTAGDSVLAEFPSVVDAVQCAVEMQRAIAEENTKRLPEQQMRFRIGVHVGDVLVKGENLFGDGVNIAARLETLAEPGGICVSGSVRDYVGKKLPVQFTNCGEQAVKNIAEPVRAYRIGASATVPVGAKERPPLPLPDKPSIAVLPFTNMSGDPEQEHFADGIAEDIITAISKVRSLFVIARNSSFTYKGRAIDVKQVAREFGVRYVLEGSVRRAGGRVRITAQLIEGVTGNHLWAERYDRDMTDIFAVQDEITSSVATAIQPAMESTERERAARKPPDSLDAWESYHRGLWHFLKAERHDNERSRMFFERAIDLDPTFAAAYAGLAVTYIWEGVIFQPKSRPRVIPLAEQHARKSISLDPMDASGHLALARSLMALGRSNEALIEANTALALNPNYAWAHGIQGAVLTFSNRPEDGIAPLERAKRLSPFDPMMWAWVHWTARACYYAHEHERAIDAARQVIHLRPDIRFGYRTLIAALGQLGRVDEAKRVFAEALTRCGEVFRESLLFRIPEESTANFEHVVDGLRKAGVVE